MLRPLHTTLTGAASSIVPNCILEAAAVKLSGDMTPATRPVLAAPRLDSDIPDNAVARRTGSPSCGATPARASPIKRSSSPRFVPSRRDPAAEGVPICTKTTAPRAGSAQEHGMSTRPPCGTVGVACQTCTEVLGSPDCLMPSHPDLISRIRLTTSSSAAMSSCRLASKRRALAYSYRASRLAATSPPRS